MTTRPCFRSGPPAPPAGDYLFYAAVLPSRTACSPALPLEHVRVSRLVTSLFRHSVGAWLRSHALVRTPHRPGGAERQHQIEDKIQRTWTSKKVDRSTGSRRDRGDCARRPVERRFPWDRLTARIFTFRFVPMARGVGSSVPEREVRKPDESEVRETEGAAEGTIPTRSARSRLRPLPHPACQERRGDPVP